MANISAIKLPDGVTYDLVDRVSTIDVATTSANGLMSSTDKSKLDGIESGAEVNYVTNITQHFIADPNDPQYIYPRSATLDYNAVGINDVELLTKTALGQFNGVCDLDASSKVPKSRLPSTSTPTADEVSEFDSDAHMNSTDMTTGSGSELEDFIDGLNISGGSALLDMFYPIGSYYETSDTTFDPNVTWGGYWELEVAGQVHVSSGTGYSVSGALTNTSDGGNKDAIVPYHNHSVNQFSTGGEASHTHSLSSHTHGTGSTATDTDRFLTHGSGSSTGISRRSIKPGTSTALTGNLYTDTAVTRKAATGGPSTNTSGAGTNHSHTVGAHNTNYTPSSDNRTDANMQPYIVVNRWHRTA